MNPLPYGKQPAAIYIDTMQDDEIDSYMVWVRTLTISTLASTSHVMT